MTTTDSKTRDQIKSRLAIVTAEHDRQREALGEAEETRDTEIRVARKAGLKLREIADVTGLTIGRISQIEKGIR